MTFRRSRFLGGLAVGVLSTFFTIAVAAQSARTAETKPGADERKPASAVQKTEDIQPAKIGNLLILPGEPTLQYEAPLETGPYPINGKSLKDLAAGLPLFSPIEGLDDNVWKDKQCSTCHQWDKVSLCDQGEVYARSDPAHMLRKQHPYGGPFKLALRNWSEAGCK